MENPEIHVEELKNDPEFLANIKRLEEECIKEESIAKAYQLLDAQLIIEADEEDINEIFTFIVNSAFDRLAQKLTTSSNFDMSSEEEIATARAIYEHGVQLYSENNQKGAKEIFLILNYTMPTTVLKDAMMIHACAVMSGKSFDEFIEKLVDVENVDETDPLAFFIQSFKQPTTVLLTMFEKYVTEAKEEIRVLEESKEEVK